MKLRVSSLAMYRLLVFVVALVLSGCALTELVDTTTTTTTAPPQDDTLTTATTVRQPSDDESSPCLAGDRPFAGDGVISAFGGANGDATQISGIRWAAHPGCERIVVDLLTADGAPAGAIDPVGVDYDAQRGVIRINLPEAITRSAIADSLFDGDLAGRVYVVSAADGRVAIDIHMNPGSAIVLRAFEIDSPSRIVVDLREDAEAAAVIGTTSSPHVVLLSPMVTWTETTVDVAGYARVGPGELVVRIFDDPTSDPVVEQVIELTETTNLWQEFALRLTGLPARPLEIVVQPRGESDDSTVRVGFDATSREIPDPPEV